LASASCPDATLEKHAFGSLAIAENCEPTMHEKGLEPITYKVNKYKQLGHSMYTVFAKLNNSQ